MELSGNLFSTPWLVGFGGLYAAAAWPALRWARWRALAPHGRQHAYLGAIVCLMLLWTLRTEVQPGLAWHLSGMVILTLMFGWSRAVIGGSIALAGITLAGLNDWPGWLPSAVLYVVLPASLCQVALWLARHFLPKHYFIYVFVNAFLAAGVIAILVALTSSALLLAAGAYTLAELQDTYLLFLPLMFFPEAVLNGWMASIMVGFRPQWVHSFRDDEYLDGK